MDYYVLSEFSECRSCHNMANTENCSRGYMPVGDFESCVDYKNEKVYWIDARRYAASRVREKWWMV